MVPVPKTAVPSWKVTVPVASAGRVAVKSTTLPYVTGFADEARVTVSDVGVTVKVPSWNSVR